MSVQIQWSGLNELRAALMKLPEELTAEASHIIEAQANGAAHDIKSGYPAGELRDGLTVTHLSGGRFTSGSIVKNTSPLAWLWDHGSVARHYITSRGHRHATGAMWGRRPPPHTFVRAAIRKREQMYAQLKDMLVRHGLLVSGGA